MEFFGKDTKESNKLDINQTIIDFLNNNAEANPTENELEDEPNKEIQQKFRPKSGWRPNLLNRTLDIFQRSVKQEILKSKPKHKRYDNLTKEERKGLKNRRGNPHITIKKAD